MTDNIYTYFIKLPPRIHEMVTPCADGYTIYIDVDLDAQGRMDAYQHAMHHINNHDWEKSDVQEIEFHAHKNRPVTS